MFVGGTGAAAVNGVTIGFITSYVSSGGDFNEGMKGGKPVAPSHTKSDMASAGIGI